MEKNSRTPSPAQHDSTHAGPISKEGERLSSKNHPHHRWCRALKKALYAKKSSRNLCMPKGGLKGRLKLLLKDPTVLYSRECLSLNTLSEVELWDAVDEEENPAGFLLIRGDSIPQGFFHIVVEVLIRHLDGRFLLMRRALEKKKVPGRWEASASGSVLCGEDSLSAALREVREETGIDRGTFTFYARKIYPELGVIFHNYHCLTDFPPTAITLQEGETMDFRWVDREDFLSFMDSEEAISWQRDRMSAYLKMIKEE